jgi:CheY-like chemotaxis protein
MSHPVLAVLDDEAEFRKALRRLLTGRGYSVEEYAFGRELLDVVASRPIDCLLLDLHMTEVSGFDVLEILRARDIHLPVIVITAHDEPGSMQRVLALGARAYLKKPVDRDLLFTTIQEVLAQAKISSGSSTTPPTSGSIER